MIGLADFMPTLLAILKFFRVLGSPTESWQGYKNRGLSKASQQYRTTRSKSAQNRHNPATTQAI